MLPELTEDEEKSPANVPSDVMHFTPNSQRCQAGVEQRAFAKRRTEHLQNKQNHPYMSYLKSFDFFELRWREMIYFFD